MECRIEARHLRQLRDAREQCPDRSQVVRLMQRRERDVLLEGGKNRDIDSGGPGVLRATMHDTMAHAREGVTGELGGQLSVQEGEQMIERAIVAETHRFAPGLLCDNLPVPAPRDEVRRGIKLLDLAAQRQLDFVTARREERELDAR